jgi:mRNA-degrading endonuclease HigB of HigAB toxin-antitoxin module
MEIWKDAKGFEGYYEVSNLGRVKRKKGKTIYKDGRVAYFSQTILKQSVNKKGYKTVYLSVNSKKYTKTVHRLVAETFIKNPLNKKTVNHKDLNKENNTVENLEWLTNKENMQHAFKNGCFKERDKTTILNIKHMKEKLCK